MSAADEAAYEALEAEKRPKRAKDAEAPESEGPVFDLEEVLAADKADAPDEKARSDSAYDIVQHLTWHRALIDEEDDGTRIEEYLELVRTSEKGEHFSIKDPFNKSIAIAFELVLSEHLDPWKIDLQQFSRLYLKRAREEEIELVTAGRIILMAWTVLKLQSDAMVELAERLTAPIEEPDPDFLDWGDIGDWDYDDEDVEFTQRVKYAPEAPIDEKVRRAGATRKVTLMELVDAFEEIRREVEERRILKEEREKALIKMRRSSGESVEAMMHKDDPETEQQLVWERILKLNGQAIPLQELHDPDVDSFVGAFNSILFLAADRKVQIWQEEFPYGDIFVQNLLLKEHAPTPEEIQRLAKEGPQPEAGLLAQGEGLDEAQNAEDAA
ncbi:MAG: segregation/condensation protein A [Euryarchaeota archaeon]|nr:segregation/condensation protein A [Euryarchaeota archaeon]